MNNIDVSDFRHFQNRASGQQQLKSAVKKTNSYVNNVFSSSIDNMQRREYLINRGLNKQAQASAKKLAHSSVASD